MSGGWHFHGQRERPTFVCRNDLTCEHDTYLGGTDILVLDLAGAREQIARALVGELVLYTLPANFGRPLGRNETYETVAERCAPIIADAVIAALASQERGE